MSTAVIYNRSIAGLFEGYARRIADGLTTLGEKVFLLTNTDVYSMKDEEITFRKAVFFDKDVLCGLRLERLGVRLFNSIGAIDTCDDKRMTCEALSDEVPMPKSLAFPLLFYPDKDYVLSFCNRLSEEIGFPLVAKRARGSLGRDVFLLNTKEEADSFIKRNFSSPLLFCEYIEESKGKDVRVYCVGKKVVASMKRENPNDFRSNIALGGTGTPYELTEDEKQFCLDVKDRLGLDFCGIDLLFRNGRPSLVCEVNSNAMFGELDSVCGCDIGKEIARYVFETKEAFSL